MFERLIGIILPVFLVIALGFAWARKAKPDMAWVNRLNMNVLAPALIFTALAGRDFDLASSGLLILASIGVVLGSGLGDFASSLDTAVTMPYGELPHWPASRVVGHEGSTLVVVTNGLRLLTYRGRRP